MFFTSAVNPTSPTNYISSYIDFRRLQAIERERLPQVLAIQHSDEEEGEDDDEEEGFGSIRNDSTDEEHGEEMHGDSLDTASPDSSFQSLSPGEYSLNERARCCF